MLLSINQYSELSSLLEGAKATGLIADSSEIVIKLSLSDLDSVFVF